MTRNESGVAAIEFALVLPVFLLLGFGLCDLMVCYSSQQATIAAAQNCATVGGRLLKQQSGDIANAKAAALATFNANNAAFGMTGTMTLTARDALDQSGSVTATDSAAVSLRCTVTQSTAIVFPTFGIFPNPFTLTVGVQS